MIIRRIKNKDLLDIWLWRNDENSIYFSKNKKIITLKSHNKWFKKKLNNKKIKFYIGLIVMKNQKKVGVVRFDIKNKYALVSINLNPAMRGKRLSYILLAAGIKKFLKYKQIKLIAEIHKKNFASIKCFLKNRFCFFKSKNQYNFYQRSLN